MGTRGLLCFIINGKKRGFYNQYDSYESGLGAAIALFILLLDEGECDMMQQKLEAEDTISPEMWNHFDSLNLLHSLLNEYTERNWYTATSGAQTGVCLPHILSGNISTLPDSPMFEDDGVFCEYSYHVDFGERIFKLANRILQGKSEWTFEELRMAGGYWYSQAISLAVSELNSAWTYSVLERMVDMGARLEGNVRFMKVGSERRDTGKEEANIAKTQWSPDTEADRKFQAEMERNRLMCAIDQFGWKHVTSASGKLPDDKACIAALGLTALSFDTSRCGTEEERWRMMYRLAGPELETILEKNLLLSEVGKQSHHKKGNFTGQAEDFWQSGVVPDAWDLSLAQIREKYK